MFLCFIYTLQESKHIYPYPCHTSKTQERTQQWCIKATAHFECLVLDALHAHVNSLITQFHTGFDVGTNDVLYSVAVDIPLENREANEMYLK